MSGAIDRDITVDVAVIGGGMAGLLSAYALQQAGKRVAILERDRLLSGATKLTTAFITQVIDTDVRDLIRMYGEDMARAIWQSHGDGIEYIERIVRDEHIDCGFSRCPSYSYSNDAAGYRQLQQEYAAMQELGFDASLHQEGALGFRHHGYIEVANQAKFEALDFLNALAIILRARGVQIFEHSPAVRVTGSGPVIVHTAAHAVTADYAITATYSPLNNPPETFLKKGMYTSYVFEVTLPKGRLPEGLYEDTANPYHYFRIDPQADHDRMIIGGEDNRAEIAFAPQKNFKALRAYLDHLLPDVPHTICCQWQGPILEPSDGLALIGEFRPRQLVATAFSGNGMTYSAIAARTFAAIINGKPAPWGGLYDPKRSLKFKPLLVKAKDYGEEFVGGALHNTLSYWLGPKL